MSIIRVVENPHEELKEEERICSVVFEIELRGKWSGWEEDESEGPMILYNFCGRYWIPDNILFDIIDYSMLPKTLKLPDTHGYYKNHKEVLEEWIDNDWENFYFKHEKHKLYAIYRPINFKNLAIGVTISCVYMRISDCIKCTIQKITENSFHIRGISTKKELVECDLDWIKNKPFVFSEKK